MLQIVLDADIRLQARRLIDWLGTTNGDPFVPDTLIVGDTGTGIWLQQQIAREISISANLNIELPGRYIWGQVQSALHQTQSQSPYDPLVARWAIHQVVESAAGEISPPEWLAPLLAAWHKASERDRIVLTTELARLFDRYLTYRRNWLDAWARQEAPVTAIAASRQRPGAALEFARRHEPWQAWLWRSLLQRTAGFSSRHPFDDYLEQQTSGAARPERASPAPAPVSPGRVALFGELGLANEQMQILALLARSKPSVWFANDPSQGFWEEILSPAQASRLAAAEPESAWLYEDQPAVLGEWGRQARDSLIQMRALEQQGQAQINDDHLRSRTLPVAETTLRRLQAAVFELSDDPWQADGVLQPDASLEVHSTHSLSRQVDVACDRVMAAIAALPDLQPGEIVIFCTDVEAAAPLIRSTFGHPALRLPVQVSGQSAAVSPKISALLALFALVEGPAHVNAVIDWFEGPAQRAGAGLGAELLGQIRETFLAAGLHRDDLSLAGSEQVERHGWREGIDRLVLGMMTGPLTAEETTELSALPVGDMSVAQIDAMEPVFRLLELIVQWRAEPGSRRPVQVWTERVLRFIDDWFAGGDDDQSESLRIRDALGELNESVSKLPDGEPLEVSLAVFAEAFNAHIEQRSGAARASGAITVAPVGSMREVPFRVCVMLGMDEGVFPARRKTGEHDLMSLLPKFGDADPGSAGRGWYLQTILNTRDRLIIAYQGRDARGDSVLNPSRPVAELLDYLSRFDWSQADSLVTTHPLQPFSPRRFATDTGTPSYALHWFQAALSLANGTDTEAGMAAVGAPTQPGLSDSTGRFWRLDDLVRTLLDPARAYLQHTGGVSLLSYETLLSDIEPLGLHDFGNPTLFAWKLQAADWMAAGWNESAIRQQLAREPAMPAGVAIEPVLRTIMTEAARICDAQARALGQLGVDSLADAVTPASTALADARLAVDDSSAMVSGQTGLVLNATDGSVVHLLPASRHLDMHSVVHTWVAHLFVCSLIPADTEVKTLTVVAGDKSADRKNPILFDRQSIRIYQGLCLDEASPWGRLLSVATQSRGEAMALFPRTAAAWLSRAEVGEPIDSPEESRSAYQHARTAFEGADGATVFPELNRSWPVALWRDEPPSFDLALRQSLACYAPIWWAMQPLEPAK